MRGKNLQKLDTRLFEYFPPEFKFHFIFFPLENIEQIRLVFISVRRAVQVEPRHIMYLKTLSSLK